MHRRGFLGGAAALAAAPTAAFAGKRQREQEQIELEIAESVEEELDALGGTRVVGTKTASDEALGSYGKGYWKDVPALDEALAAVVATRVKYWGLDPAVRLAPAWVEAEHHPDTFHLDAGAPADPAFEVDAALLRGLADANAFPLADAPIHLFGLRGAVLPAGTTHSGGWVARQALTLATPDHVERRCVIGAWRASDDNVWLFSASTVPQIANMYAVVAGECRGWGCSLLPAGRYSYLSGTHKAGKATAQPGALQVQGEYVVLRATAPYGEGKLGYDVRVPHNAWTEGSGHNLHAAGSSRTNPRFDSSGCQVVRGGYNEDRTAGTGDWLLFQKAAGLADADGVPGADGRPYGYFVLPGLEAALLAGGDAAYARDYRRLRPGSRGPRVEAMRQALAPGFETLLGQKTPAPGPDFDLWTSFLVLHAHKRDAGEFLGPVWRG